jgi:1,4-alpha-glucan branching enzyme
VESGGIGFDYRLSMGIPDLWIKYTKDIPDEKWDMSRLYHELTQHRPDEHTISYAESHDQALVGDKTLMFRLTDKEMYHHMQKDDENIVVDRGVALHKMIRLLTASLNYGGYLNFMGNEFGHPEWIDFPRAGNNWSYHYARRQWSLVEDKKLKYHFLANFDKAMTDIIRQLASDPSDAFIHDEDHVIGYVRGGLVFAYNFHPTQSFENYGFSVPSGDYGMILSSDDSQFGGSGRIDATLNYPSNGLIKLYLPARTAVVLGRRLLTP